MKIKNIVMSIAFIILLFITVNLINLRRLPTYNMSNDGRTIEKDNIQYISLGIANDGNIGRRIGKIEYNSETYYVYEVKNQDSHKYIIAIGNDIGVAEEYVNKDVKLGKEKR